MQISKVYFLTALIAVLPGALAGICKPKKPVYTCDGHLKCCTMPLQGVNNVAAYCSDGDMTDAGCSAMNVICCSEAAEKTKALTPRGYTYIGCSTPVVSYQRM